MPTRPPNGRSWRRHAASAPPTVGRCSDRAADTRYLAEAAALARIDELGGRMATREAADTDDQKATARAMWALGDYHRFAKQTVWDVGPVLVAACGIAAGSARARRRGRERERRAPRGRDGRRGRRLRPHAGEPRRRSPRGTRPRPRARVGGGRRGGPSLRGRRASTSSRRRFGAMFAPNHQQVADELLRVCRPGGTIGMANFVPDGVAGRVLRDLRAARASAAARRAPARALGERGARARALRRPGRARSS